MNSTLITNAQIVYPGKKIALGQLLLTGGRIAAIIHDERLAEESGVARGVRGFTRLA